MKYSALILFLTTAVAGMAQAQSTYVDLSAGQTNFNGGSLNQSGLNSALSNSGGTVTSSNFSNSPTSYKLLVGENITPNFALEGGYVNLGKLNYSANLADGGASQTFKSQGFVLDAVGIVPLNKDFSLTGKLGVYYGEGSTSATNTSVAAASAFNGLGSSWNARLNYGIGATYALTPQWSLRTEYERFDNVGSNAINGGKTNANMLTVGVAAKF